MENPVACVGDRITASADAAELDVARAHSGFSRIAPAETLMRLLSFGNGIKAVKPESLRQELLEQTWHKQASIEASPTDEA